MGFIITNNIYVQSSIIYIFILNFVSLPICVCVCVFFLVAVLIFTQVFVCAVWRWSGPATKKYYYILNNTLYRMLLCLFSRNYHVSLFVDGILSLLYHQLTYTMCEQRNWWLLHFIYVYYVYSLLIKDTFAPPVLTWKRLISKTFRCNKIICYASLEKCTRQTLYTYSIYIITT